MRRQLLRGAAGAALLAAAAGMQATAAPAAKNNDAHCCAIVELRQYTLKPGRFNAFAQLFEDAFVEPLEAAGMTVIGQFHDLDDPDRFVWLRGFRDMPSRAQSLEAFYGGPLWKARRDEANANFIDTDNVLLLHPAGANGGIELAGTRRAAVASRANDDGGLVLVTVYRLDPGSADTFPAFFEQQLRPALRHAGIDVAGAFETEPGPNNFPRLPVREGERNFVWIARFADQRHGDAALQGLVQSARWREQVMPELQRRARATQQLRLAPTPRSRLRG